jgi:hypothetical protein
VPGREGMSGKGGSTTLGEVEVGSAGTGRNEWERELYSLGEGELEVLVGRGVVYRCHKAINLFLFLSLV